MSDNSSPARRTAVSDVEQLVRRVHDAPSAMAVYLRILGEDFVRILWIATAGWAQTPPAGRGAGMTSTANMTSATDATIVEQA